MNVEQNEAPIITPIEDRGPPFGWAEHHPATANRRYDDKTHIGKARRARARYQRKKAKQQDLIRELEELKLTKIYQNVGSETSELQTLRRMIAFCLKLLQARIIFLDERQYNTLMSISDPVEWCKLWCEIAEK